MSKHHRHADDAVAGDTPQHDAFSVDSSLEYNRKRAFWMRLFYAGMASYFTVVPTILAYAWLTRTQPNRFWMAVIAVGSLVAMWVTYLLRKKIVTARQRQWVFFTGNTLSFMILAVLSALDGGIDSPIAYMLILPMLYLAIAYRLRTALVCGLTGLLCYAALLWFAPGPKPLGSVLFQVLTLGVGFLMATLGARNRDQQNQAMRALRQQLQSMAMTDDLTGCRNQRAFNVALRAEVARAGRHERSLSLLLIDIDHFKQINDRHGHLMGDMVLRQVGEVLRSSARESGCVGRPGGDELAVLAPDTDGAGALMLAERMRETARSAVLPIEITLSIGVCAMSSPTEEAIELFRRADEAMYVAKRNGRDRAVLWNADDMAPARGATSSTGRQSVRREILE